MYNVTTDLFDGPLPLLVELAKLNLMDIFIMKLQGLTAQYLAEVKHGQATLNELAEPLPLLGQLVAMKARQLLPQPPAAEDDEEIPFSLQELERRLKEYEQFKTVAQVLAELHVLQHEHFSRAEAQLSDLAGDAGGRSPAPLEVGIVDLMAAFARVLEKAPVPIYEVETEPWTVEMKVDELTLLLTVKRQVQFNEMFSAQKTRLELVVIFLALLELVRRRVCLAVQERQFGEILIVRRDSSEGS